MTVLKFHFDAMKRCSKCKVFKPITEFYRHSGMPDGFAYDCKACRKQYHKEWRSTAKGKALVSQAGKRRRASPEGRASIQRASAKYRASAKGMETSRRSVKRYSSTHNGRAVINRAVKAWRMEYPERHNAHATVARALKSGKITAMPCIVCGATAEAHHPDYSAPLDVVWLCPLHHKQTHALIKMVA